MNRIIKLRGIDLKQEIGAPRYAIYLSLMGVNVGILFQVQGRKGRLSEDRST
jgi:hypothetical protein